MVVKRNPDLTRDKLLQAAFAEIYRHGYQAASLDGILETAGVTKGALYHHFASKKELGYAVIDEVIRHMITEWWLRPLDGVTDPVTVLMSMMDKIKRELPPEHLELGCPLNNLAQEMSPLDNGFRERTHRLFKLWRSGFADALERGQNAGTVRKDVDPSIAAGFLIAAMEGAQCLAKNAQSMDVLEELLEGVRTYLLSIHTPANIS